MLTREFARGVAVPAAGLALFPPVIRLMPGIEAAVRAGKIL
jgi:hypothetical protein